MPAATKASAAAVASPEKPTGNRYDTMFGSDHEDGTDDENPQSRKHERKDKAPESNPKPSTDNDDDEEQLDDLFGDDEEGRAKEKELFSDGELGGSRGSPSPEPERSVEITLPRHPGPSAGCDSQLYLMKIPSFLSMEPQLFDPEKFVLPQMACGETVSAYTKATTAIRVRRDPRNQSQLQSNARVIRWNDGTMSLQIASSPTLFDLPQKDLTTDPRQPEKYKATQDSQTYILDPHESAGTLRVVGHATRFLNVVSASVNLASDYAIQRLHNELQSAVPTPSRTTPLELSELRDPEAERKEAERIAKEKERANRKLEAQRRRARDRDPLEAAAKRSYARVTGTRSKRDSPPITRGGRVREDEYDLEDEFIEGSDEEEEEAEATDEDDDDEDVEERPARRQHGESRDRKRRRVVDSEEE